MVVGFMLYPHVLDFLKRPYLQVNPDADLYAFSLTEGFAIRMETAMYLGAALAMPVILWQLWRFVTPGLYPHEKRYAIPFVFSALVLFVAGAAIAYVCLPATITFLQEIGTDEVIQVTGVQSYLKLNLFMMLAFGAGFEFPVLLVFLMLVKVLTWRQLVGWWRYATVVIAVTAAVITPGGDPVSMVLLAAPMLVLYFVAIAIGAFIAWRRTRAEPTTTGS